MAAVTPEIFSDSFAAEPWWWRDYRPPADPPAELPAAVDVLIVGAGYAGTTCALRLAEAGRDVLVLDADALGYNASSRSGGQVTGGVNIGKSLAHKPVPPERRAAMLRDAARGLALFEDLLTRYRIDCDYHPNGRLIGFWTPAHEASWRARAEELNEVAGSQARIVGREEAAAELGSRFYWGGMTIGRAGHIQPARYFGGLLAAARGLGARFHGQTKVLGAKRDAGGTFAVKTSRGTIQAERIVFATNAYTGAHSYGLDAELRRGLIPVTTHMIATEEMPADLAASVLPTDRGVSESRRVIAHYRKSPDGRRLLFGGRVTFLPLAARATAALLHKAMVARFPQLAGVRIANGWGGKVAVTLDRVPHIGGGNGRYFAAGCQGSGITMMSYLGYSLGEKILGGTDEPVNAYDTGHPPHRLLYDGTPWFMPVVGSWYQFQDDRDRRTG